MSSVRRLVEQRTSVNRFDTRHPLEEAQIIELVRLATLSPSAYNFQNWKFIAVRDSGAKERLKAAAYGQQKVVDPPRVRMVVAPIEPTTRGRR